MLTLLGASGRGRLPAAPGRRSPPHPGRL